MDNPNENYMSYGHYGYYKTKVLQRMFDISERMVTFIAEYDTKGDSKNLTTGQLGTIWKTPIYLKVAIIELLPKLSKIKDKKKDFDFSGIDQILKYNNTELINDFNLLISFYQKYISLIEALGYSDMNVIREAMNIWEQEV